MEYREFLDRNEPESGSVWPGLHQWRGFLHRNPPVPAGPIPAWAGFFIQLLGESIEETKELVGRAVGRIEGAIMAAQDDINNAITAIGAVLTDVQGDVATLGADLQAWIAAQPPSVDTSGLAALVTGAQSAAAALDAQTTAITNAVNPVPAPAPNAGN